MQANEVSEDHLRRYAGLQSHPELEPITDPDAPAEAPDSEINSTSSTEPDTQPEVEADDTYPVVTQNKQRFANPWAKLILVGSGVGLVGLVFAVVMGTTFSSVKQAQTPTPRSAPAPSETDPTTASDPQNQKGHQQTAVALTTQEHQLRELNKEAGKSAPATTPASKKIPGGSTPSYSYKPTRMMTPSANPLPTPTRAVYSSATSRPNYTPSVSSYTPPFPSKSASVTYSNPVKQRPATQAVSYDSAEDWQAASDIGAYGGESDSEATLASNSSTEVTNSPEQPAAQTPSAASDLQQTAISSHPSTLSGSSQSAMGTVGNQPSTTSPASGPSAVNAVYQPTQASPQFTPQANSSSSQVNPSTSALASEEQAFLADVPMIQIDAGATGNGYIEIPAILGSTNQFLIHLSSPLKSTTGAIAIPQGSRIVAQIETTLPNGMVQASAVAVIRKDSFGRVNQVPLPTGVIQVFQPDGQPLQAKAMNNKRSRMAGMNARSFLLGALGKASSLFNQRNQNVVSNSSGYLVTNENSDTNLTNIAAGLVQGGTEAMLPQMEARQQQAQQDIAKQPDVMVLEAGTEIKLQVTSPFDFNGG